MSDERKKYKTKTKVLNPKKSIDRANSKPYESNSWSLEVAEERFSWSTRMDRLSIIRAGLPYGSIEVISSRTNLPIKQVLSLLGLAQTTYNKRKKEQELLPSRDSELVLVLTELLDFGLEVFNQEKEKFQLWQKKPNTSLGGATPNSLFDSLTGIQEVRNSLNRLEYGNLA